MRPRKPQKPGISSRANPRQNRNTVASSMAVASVVWRPKIFFVLKNLVLLLIVTIVRPQNHHGKKQEGRKLLANIHQLCFAAQSVFSLLPSSLSRLFSTYLWYWAWRKLNSSLILSIDSTMLSLKGPPPPPPPPPWPPPGTWNNHNSWSCLYTTKHIPVVYVTCDTCWTDNDLTKMPSSEFSPPQHYFYCHIVDSQKKPAANFSRNFTVLTTLSIPL